MSGETQMVEKSEQKKLWKNSSTLELWEIWPRHRRSVGQGNKMHEQTKFKENIRMNMLGRSWKGDQKIVALNSEKAVWNRCIEKGPLTIWTITTDSASFR